MSGLSQLVHDLLLPSDTGVKLRDVPLGLSKVLVVHASRVAQARDERLAKRIVSKRSLYCRDARTIRLSDISRPRSRARGRARGKIAAAARRNSQACKEGANFGGLEEFKRFSRFLLCHVGKFFEPR